MNVFVSQIYIEPGICYPFTHVFQKWLSKALTARVRPSSRFIKTYGKDFDLIFRVSAKSNLEQSEIKGPTVFRRQKDVEFTIFLPHDGQDQQSDYEKPLRCLLDGISTVLVALEIDPKGIEIDKDQIIHAILSDPAMISKELLSGGSA